MNSREVKQHVERQKLGQARHMFWQQLIFRDEWQAIHIKEIPGDEVKR